MQADQVHAAMEVIGRGPKREIAVACNAGVLAVGVTTGRVFMAADPGVRAPAVLPGLDGLMAQGVWG